MSRLVVRLHRDDALIFTLPGGDEVTVSLGRIGGNICGVTIEAPQAVRVRRRNGVVQSEPSHLPPFYERPDKLQSKHKAARHQANRRS